MNDWNRIRAFYQEHLPAILAEERCEWGIPTYHWDNGMLRMTPIEVALWADIRECNAIFYPQFPVGRFFVDFANPKARIAIECDGAEIHHHAIMDAERDSELRDLGWEVYRIPGWACMTESDPETGAPGQGMRFVRDIAERHRISRHHKTRQSAEWFTFTEIA